MASGTTSEKPPRESPRGQRFVEYEQYIDDCVRKTGSHLKLRDLAGSALMLAISVLAILLVAAVLDHWVVAGGLGTIGRLLFCALLVGAAGYFLLRQVLPTLTRRINPVYAAHTIEHSTPSLKNTLLNFLMFRRDRTPVPSAVYEVIEEQAAARLSEAPIDSAVDRSNLVRLARVLAGAIVVLAIYTFVSPKNPWASAARVLMPLSDRQVPSRVEIVDIEPAQRDIDVPRGNQLVVSAKVNGVDEDDPVMLFYSTDDSRYVDQPLAMHVAPGDYRYGCLLPASESGVQQDMTFRIEAGDAVTPTYRVRVTAAPTIAIESIHYEYPAYTGRSSHRIAGKGDIRVLEGTRVTLRAKANAGIQSAHIDFDCDGRSDRAMRVSVDDDRTTAQVSFTLALSDDGQTPQQVSYQLWFTNSAGHKNRQPVKYAIEVIADEAPKIKLVAPTEREVTLPLNGQLDIETVASDPDYALSKVSLHALSGDRSVFDTALLKEQRSGKFEGKWTFVPRQHKLRAGDVVTYWATAEDNKAPDANRAETERRRIRIVAPDRQAERERDGSKKDQQSPDKQQPPQDDEQENSDGADEGANESGDKSGDGESSEGGEPGSGEPSEGSEPNNGESSESGESGESGESQQGDEGQSEENGAGRSQAEPGEGTPSEEPSGGESSADTPSEEGEGESSAGEGESGEAGGDGGEKGGARERDGSGDPTADHEQPSDGEPVPSDGSDDGSAFEKIREHMQQESGDGSSQSGENETGKAEQTERDQGGDTEAPTRKRMAEEGEGTDGTAQERNGDERDQASDAGDERPPGEAAGDETAQRENSEQASDAESTGADKGSQGEAGAGKENRDKQGQGTPESQQETKPDDKQPGDNANQPPSDSAQPPTSAHGNKESDSQGDQGGDKSGGGEKGGGQKSNQSGEGDAGQNQPADQGGGEANEPGDSVTGDEAGDGAKADSPTGEAGDEAGKGSGQRPKSDAQKGDSPKSDQANQDQQPGDDSAERDGQPESGNPSGQPKAGNSQSGEPGEGGPSGKGQTSAKPTGGGESSEGADGPADERPADKNPEVADKANLEYARKVTDLVLERLEDQAKKDKVDPKLLDKLGWSKEDMQRFLTRWQQMKRDAQRTDRQGAGARRELDDALRSLGVRKDRVRRGPGSSSKAQGKLRQSKRRATPVELREQLEAYLRRTSRGK